MRKSSSSTHQWKAEQSSLRTAALTFIKLRDAAIASLAIFEMGGTSVNLITKKLKPFCMGYSGACMSTC